MDLSNLLFSNAAREQLSEKDPKFFHASSMLEVATRREHSICRCKMDATVQGRTADTTDTIQYFWKQRSACLKFVYFKHRHCYTDYVYIIKEHSNILYLGMAKESQVYHSYVLPG